LEVETHTLHPRSIAQKRTFKLRNTYFHLVFFLCVGILMSVHFFANIYPGDIAADWASALKAPVVFSFTVIEMVFLAWLLSLFPARGWLWGVLGYLLIAVFMVVETGQFLSLYYSGNMLNPLAFAHAELFALVLNSLSVGTVVVGVPGVMIVHYLLLRRFAVQHPDWRSRVGGFITMFLVLTVLIVANNNLQLAKEIRWDYQAGKVSPLLGLISAVRSMDRDISDEIKVELTEREMRFAQQLGMQIKPDSSLPMVKNRVYTQPFPIPQNRIVEQPNLIVIFAESLSSVLLDPYGSGYGDLTPNLSRFSGEAMVVEGYYGHVAPTVVGLRGQLCSSFPYLTHKDWMRLKFAPPKKPNRCLPKMFAEAGYESIYFGGAHPGKSFLGYQMDEVGFGSVLMFDDLLDRYLPGESTDRGRKGNSDRQMFEALSAFINEREGDSRPFFLGLSTVETHFGINGLDTDIRYGDGTQPVLNMFHSFDRAFGRFWDEFKRSQLAENTILVVTADHAHGPGGDFWPVVRDTNYKRSFFERIPFMIYDPTRTLPARLRLYGSSLSFAPTVWQMVGGENGSNHFLGKSLFDGGDQSAFGIIFGNEVGLIDAGRELRGRRSLQQCPNDQPNQDQLCQLYRVLRYLQQAERNGMLWPDSSTNHTVNQSPN
jgi:phosphoglycerol transferase MdoB-like AlkP superfamily enzyme